MQKQNKQNKLQKALWGELFDKLDDLHDIVREKRRIAIEDKKEKKAKVYVERDPH